MRGVLALGITSRDAVFVARDSTGQLDSRVSFADCARNARCGCAIPNVSSQIRPVGGQEHAGIEAKIKLGRVAGVTDLMGPAVFLCSDAGAMITGTHLLVDGGWTAG